MTSPDSNIRFAVMINGGLLKKWQADSLKRLTDSGLCSCVLIISNPDSQSSSTGTFKKYLGHDSLYRFLLHRWFRVDAESEVAVSDEIPLVELQAESKGHSQYFSPSQIETIQSYQPHFILRFGYNILRGDVLNCVPMGIWSFHHGDERYFRGGPFAFWEIVKRVPKTGVILQKLTSKLDSGHVLLRRHYITVFHSWKEMRQRMLSENTDMPLLAVKKYIIQKENIPVAQVSQAKIYKAPGWFRTSTFVFKLLISRFKHHVKRLFQYEDWHVESGVNTDSPLTPSTKTDFVLRAERGSFYADPFLLAEKDDFQVLCEHFSYREGVGKIRIASPSESARDCIVRDTHLAYPFVFQHNGKNYVIPENAASGSCIAIELDENHHPAREIVLMNQAVVDPTMLFHEGRFYIFCGLKNDLPNEKLYIFWSDSFEGPFQPHEMNPVKVTPEGSRPGGNLFIFQNEWYRPAQVSEKYYGQKVQIYKILQLSPNSFIEELCVDILPERFGNKFVGLHTYATVGKRFAIDLKRHRWGFAAFGFRSQRTERSKDV